MVRDYFFDLGRDKKIHVEGVSRSRLRSLTFELRRSIVNVVPPPVCHDAACSTSCSIAQLRDSCPRRQGYLSESSDFTAVRSAPQGRLQTEPALHIVPCPASTHLVRR